MTKLLRLIYKLALVSIIGGIAVSLWFKTLGKTVEYFQDGASMRIQATIALEIQSGETICFDDSCVIKVVGTTNPYSKEFEVYLVDEKSFSNADDDGYYYLYLNPIARYEERYHTIVTRGEREDQRAVNQAAINWLIEEDFSSLQQNALQMFKEANERYRLDGIVDFYDFEGTEEQQRNLKNPEYSQYLNCVYSHYEFKDELLMKATVIRDYCETVRPEYRDKPYLIIQYSELIKTLFNDRTGTSLLYLSVLFSPLVILIIYLIWQRDLLLFLEPSFFHVIGLSYLGIRVFNGYYHAINPSLPSQTQATNIVIQLILGYLLLCLINYIYLKSVDKIIPNKPRS